MGLLSPSSLSAFLGPEWRFSLHSYIVIYHSPCSRGIFDSARGAACHWFRPYPPHRVDSISLIFVFWRLLFCPVWSSQLKLKSGCIRWLVRFSLQEHENSVVSAFRSLNKINEFPGKVRGSQKQSQLCLSICHPHETMVLIFLSLVWIFSKTQLQQLSTCGQFETMGLLWKPLFRPSVSDVFPEKTSSDSAGAGQTTPLETQTHRTYPQGRFCKERTAGFTRESPLSRKTQAPALALPNAQWPSCTYPRGHYPCLLCPWGCHRAPRRLASVQRIILMTRWNIWGLGLQPGPILV